jgi:hypothetical protein
MKPLRLDLQIALALILGACTSVLATESPVPSGKSDIEYSTLEEALNALRAKTAVIFNNQDGGLDADDSSSIVIWLFTPPGHLAYPSIIKRQSKMGLTGAYMETAIRCLASPGVCDRYLVESRRLRC